MASRSASCSITHVGDRSHRGFHLSFDYRVTVRPVAYGPETDMIDPVDGWLLFLMLTAVALAFAVSLVWRLYFADRAPRDERGSM